MPFGAVVACSCHAWLAVTPDHQDRAVTNVASSPDRLKHTRSSYIKQCVVGAAVTGVERARDTPRHNCKVHGSIQSKPMQQFAFSH